MKPPRERPAQPGKSPGGAEPRGARSGRPGHGGRRPPPSPSATGGARRRGRRAPRRRRNRLL